MSKNRKQEIDEVIESIIDKNMIDVMSDRFARYSKYIIQQRAIPDAKDGLKPVQRRILYSMWNLKLKNNQPFKKSARIVGDVIGRYHPHGDSSIYEALVRMSQEWKSNYPLIQMHGNKGSIDDDPAAAMRYTESRLEKISELLLSDLDKKVVPLAPNFDDTEYEPIVLPSLIPNLLINGAKGIAAGFATEIPPHNLNEVIDATIHLINHPTASNEDLMQIVLGPDFPTGGIIQNIEGIKQAFETGQGKIYISSKYRYIYDSKNEEKIVGVEIYEIPFGVIKSKIVTDIDTLVFDKTINGIKEVRDQSNREGISIYLELNDDANVEAIMNYLLSKTDLRIAYNYNMVAICDNAPKLMNLYTLIGTYLSHLREINTNAILFDLNKYKMRLEIVEGFIKVAEISDEVIKVIKNSDNSKKGVIEALENTFGFTNLQATAIAELRLYKLSRMDQIEYINESKTLKEDIKRCNLLLNDPKEFDKYLINQLSDIKNEFGRARLTEISDDKINTNVDVKLLAKKEDYYFFISKEGYFKRLSVKAFASNELKTYKLKEQDNLLYFNKINSLSKLIFFTNLGNFFVIDAHILKESSWKDLGIHISTIVALDNNEKIIRVLDVSSFDSYVSLLFITKKGMAKRVAINEFDSKSLNRKRNCIKLKGNDALLDVKITNKEKMLILLITGGLYYLFKNHSEIPLYSLSASGIKLLYKLDNDQEIEGFSPISYNNKLVITTTEGQFKIVKCDESWSLTSRISRGKKFFDHLKSVKSQISNVEVYTKDLQCYYTNANNELESYDLKNVDLTEINTPISRTRLNNFNASATLIQPITIYELPEESIEERNKIRLENNLVNTQTIETTLFKHQYIYDDDFYNEKSNFEIKEQTLEQDIPLFEETPDFVEHKKEKQPKEEHIATKESVQEKLDKVNEINIDDLLNKIKDLNKK
ncbi:DNA gyrase subunit A [Metamycoplasma cloacale]|uniref:DNA topoisomerase (ATP-hydrolyzing) n=1 Tax=Metamycoplasma cloacale TaxID=92401 RepID=A0A2Z4LLT2_9BACT|nr:DNA topoisomerase (ATP-hydrolyzing) [Metamycoplasma cloacale]AWX42650.1 DNA topoisomerase 4 subunit A [Metamycoplasma cloacale]VEU79557.1 DNA gyrase subunit A [Metamycoplasma cloacale]